MKKICITAIIIAFGVLGCKDNKEANKESSKPTSNTLSAKDEEAITNTHWKLIKLEGQEIVMAKNQERESYFMLKTEPKRLTGFSGCNTFSGNYSLEEGWRIRFSQMASTMKACPDVDVDESKFLKVFELADNYTVNGDTLSLNVGRRAPLAVFKAVHFE